MPEDARPQVGGGLFRRWRNFGVFVVVPVEKFLVFRCRLGREAAKERGDAAFD